MDELAGSWTLSGFLPQYLTKAMLLGLAHEVLNSILTG
jgi:hypothetical protein|tara:strand:+ start:39 stop:152 length:114 start_codon:yes stop_codon:yes gene_type:complete